MLHPVRLLLPALLALVPWHACANAQEAQATGHATASLVSPISVTSLADLDFGMVRADRLRGGSVTLPASGGSPRFAGGAHPACGKGPCPVPHPALFAIEGEPGRFYEVWLDESLPIASSTPGAPELAVVRFTVHTLSLGDAGRKGRLDRAGQDQMRIGATLVLPAGLFAARYRKMLPVTVNYQ